MTNQPPRLTFFCELDPHPLLELFDRPGLLELLKAMSAGVSLGLMDASRERAEVVLRLNQAGIPVTAWLLLPKEQGYWFNLDNADQAAGRYSQFRAWSEQYGLHWAAVGLDVEMDIRAMQALAKDRLRAAGPLIKTLAVKERFQRGSAIFRELVRQIRADGFPVESYQFEFIADERQTGAQLLQRLAGIVDLPVDREVFMLYSSFVPSLGAGLLAEYGPESGGIGLGSTGGGVTMEGMPPLSVLRWEELERDLLLAAGMRKPVYLFSLEGCVQQGFLERLADFDWQRAAEVPAGQHRRVKRYRRLLRGALRFSRLFLR